MADEIVKHAAVREREPNKLATTNTTNELVRAIGQLGQSPSVGRKHPQQPIDKNDLWVVVTAGPNGESDYADERYWVRRVYISNADDDYTSQLATTQVTLGGPPTLQQSGMWVTATNLAELLGHTHSLSEGFVFLDMRFINDKSSPLQGRYVFQSGGGGSGGVIIESCIGS